MLLPDTLRRLDLPEALTWLQGKVKDWREQLPATGQSAFPIAVLEFPFETILGFNELALMPEELGIVRKLLNDLSWLRRHLDACEKAFAASGIRANELLLLRIAAVRVLLDGCWLACLCRAKIVSGVDARLVATELESQFRNYCQKLGWKVEL